MEYFWVTVALVIFFVIVFGVFKAHKTIGAGLDARADKIRAQLDEARKLREEAQTELAALERKRREAEKEAEQIVARAKEDAKNAAALAEKSLEESIARKLKAAEERIAQAKAAAERDIRNSAVGVAIAAEDVLRQKVGPEQDDVLIDEGIRNLATRLN